MLDFTNGIFAHTGDCKVIEFLNACNPDPTFYLEAVDGMLPPEGGQLRWELSWVATDPSDAYPTGTGTFTLEHTATNGWILNQE